MQELAPHVFIETNFPGVTLGAISWAHGLILIDAPFRAEDTRSWRAALLNLSGGVDRLLINMDAHLDRTLGARAMDCTVVGHEKMAMAFRNRPMTFKAQGDETGAEWESYNGLGSIRWAPPEITFSDQMCIHWETEPLLLDHRPGPAGGAIWATLPVSHVILVGDAVLPDQPPFLSYADLPVWIEALELLLSSHYRDYLVVSGRGGLVAQQQIRAQLGLLQYIHQLLEALAQRDGSPEDAAEMAHSLLSRIHFPADRAAQYEQRLRYGLRNYFIRHYRPLTEDIEES
jgi:glyoxylase-like metal-dependent hydrolase (beta-lactamase superfamily II)